jgi:hypothetical protein
LKVKCRFPFNLSLLIFQLAPLTLSSCHQRLAVPVPVPEPEPEPVPVSGQGVIDFFLYRDLEDASSGGIDEQI